MQMSQMPLLVQIILGGAQQFLKCWAKHKVLNAVAELFLLLGEIIPSYT